MCWRGTAGKKNKSGTTRRDFESSNDKTILTRPLFEKQPERRTGGDYRSTNRTKASDDARNRTTRAGDSQTITRGCARRSGARCLTEHVVQHVHVVERRRRSRTKTLWEGSVDSRTKPTSTCVERKHKRRIDETTRTLGAHGEAL